MNSFEYFCLLIFRAYRKIKNCRINVEGRLYIVGETQFESLVSLINYYTRNPLYRNVKLTYPISKEMLKTMSKRYGNEAMVRLVLSIKICNKCITYCLDI